MHWATFWAIFSSTHLVAMMPTAAAPKTLVFYNVRPQQINKSRHLLLQAGLPDGFLSYQKSQFG
jgi:hypothetical protein